MDWVAGLPPGGDRSYNSFLLIANRFTKTPIFFPCHKDDTAIVTALLIWNKVVSLTGIFTHVISDRDPKCTSELLTNLHKIFGAKLSFSTAYNPQTYGLATSMIQTLEEMVRRFFAHILELNYCHELSNYCFNLLPALPLAYKTSIHASTNQTPSILEEGWNT
ncbi:hypothetical protein O181_021442 [Austropuccinia psidii MF-1]|uniref:Integrase catalytic domain-containing protein n=1 Tax=Austropuccinia psidii MF-1 TaxID=1389203 RepID=A0A9Q3CFJ0_9BASI|nr:hypothetical protein [Austropuccinia psidii MF-1]